MPVEIPAGLREQYLAYFRDAKRFRIPGRDPTSYNVADHFFTNISFARRALVDLLKKVPFPKPVELGEGVYAEFTITGHAKVKDVSGLGDNVIQVGEAQPLSKEGAATAQLQSEHVDPNSLVICSHLPRAIHHAILRYNPNMQNQLKGLADGIERQMMSHGGDIARKTLVELIEIALNQGIIPTPLLGAHYHGMRALLPIDQKDVEVFLKSPFFQNLYDYRVDAGGSLKDTPLEFFNRIAGYIAHGRDAVVCLEGSDGKILTESAFLYVQRLSYLLELFSPFPRQDEGRRGVAAVFNPLNGEFYGKIKGRKINFVGHSSNIDKFLDYFRHFSDLSRFIIERADGSKTKGAEVVVSVDKNFCYLNDPRRLDPIRTEAYRVIDKLRSRSVDELVREKRNGILETPLLGFRSTATGDKRYEPYPERLEDALASPDPIIIFGHGGQGKTILATEISKRFLEGGFGEAYRKYIPVILNCDDLNLDATVNQGASGSPKIESLMRGQTKELHPALLKEFRFIFIIDDYQKLKQPDYTQETEDAIHNLRREGNLVIILSRMERADVHPPFNPGYKTMQIDTDGIAKQTDEFIRGRICPEHAQRFKEYLSQYDSSITGYYLTKLFLTKIFPAGNGENKGVILYVLDPHTQEAISRGMPLTRIQLYDAQTDYICGWDIARMHHFTLGIEQVREEIGVWKNQLAEKAYQDVFGKNPKRKV